MSAIAPLKLRSYLPHAFAILIAGTACLGVAFWAKELIEEKTATDIGLVLAQNGHDWAEVTTDGLQVALIGTAPNEATRFAALSAAGRIVDASRILDLMEVKATAALKAPDFSIEILKNNDGISLIGLVPTESDPATILERARRIAGNAQIADLLESADYAPPPGWERALTFGLNTLEAFPRSKVSISPNRVAITAAAADLNEKRRIERQLNRDAPTGVALDLNITAPREVIAPFTLRFLKIGETAQFDACSADTEQARDAILAAAIAAGLSGPTTCPLGLGTPSTQWGEAAVASIQALNAIGEGTVTLSNVDITLVAAENTSLAEFDRAVGELNGRLPEVFSLNAARLEREDQVASDGAKPEFLATRSPEGLVQLRGRLGDDLTQMAVRSFAAAHFGSGNVYPATRLDASLPAGWPTRVLTALESLAILNNGAAIVTADSVEVSGVSGRPDARGEITRILSSKLPEGTTFALDISYSEALDPLAALPTPEECVEKINEAVAQKKITFAPSSTEIEDDAMTTIDSISELLRDCQTVKIEIGGHTDSQGREVMNEQLSQARADAVLNAIMARRVLTSNLTAKGYGETQPIADNDTEAGREANRRIEFRLVVPETVAQDGPVDADSKETSQ
ncbi:OmpA family protein [Boseongicola aestuarii]|uniref:Outer membrane porin F n=1 Tax=Boseongicola aestuarii TaxID=1470561 RepID=A0A238IXQ3_9RHOB|nr:OmpA family protein [Boseongicola aestuarii]SMX23166.1 Outer membrane porin F precursor [Boseongicola aestuarii]